MSRTEKDKGALEVRLVRMFAGALKLKIASEPQKLSPPNPDVELVLESGERIGVELSALQLCDRFAHRTEPSFKNALRDARELYLQEGGTPVCVRIFRSFLPDTQDGDARRELAKRWASLVRAHLPAPGEFSELNVASDAGRVLPPLVEAVTISTRPEHGDGWRMIVTAPASMVTVDELQTTISAKDAAVARYGPNWAQRWLLLHNGFGPEALAASRFSPQELGQRFKFRSAFDRAFLMTGERVEELTIDRSG